MSDTALHSLTGLTSDDLAAVLKANPRAYMAVKGAVAEKHLELVLQRYVDEGRITTFKSASSDFDKDFYVTMLCGTELSIECKNFQVLKVDNTKNAPLYIQYLIDNELVDEEDIRQTITKTIALQLEGELLGVLKKLLPAGLLKALILTLTSSNIPKGVRTKAQMLEYVVSKVQEGVFTRDAILSLAVEGKYGPTDASIVDFLQNFTGDQIKKVMEVLGQELRESGLPRYEFSASLLSRKTYESTTSLDFLEQFDNDNLSIDFQRTRNSTDVDGDNRRNRLYEVGEVDIVAGCLFSRTLSWEFIFAKASNLDRHKNFDDRYASALKVDKTVWSRCLIEQV